MSTVTFLVKPASSLCDLRCRYCFYEDVAASRCEKDLGRMSLETAEQLLRRAAEAVGRRGQLHFLFQGGEPTLAGLSFYERFLESERKLLPPGVAVSHAIQTNGMTVNEDWARLFRDHRFLVGLSMDGSRELHDRCRVDPAGRGTWDRCLRALRLLDEAGVETNLLCVVTRAAARSPQRIYTQLRRLGSHPLQFIPCLDPLEAERGSLSYSLTPEAYGAFLCALFDLWYRDWQAGNAVSIRFFDDCLRLLLGLAPGSCASSGGCGNYLVVEGDGSLYPCDFYVLDEWRIGDLEELSVAEALASPVNRRFLQEGAQRPPECAACPYEPVCHGGCRRDWLWDGGISRNYYCSAFRIFFDSALPRLRQVAAALSHR